MTNPSSRAAPVLVIFDMDDVLFEFSRPQRLANLAALTGLPTDHLHEVIWASGFDDDNDRGLYTPEAYLDHLQDELGVTLSGEAFIGARTAAMRPDPEVWALVGRLKPLTHLALLTNNGPLLKAALPRAFPQVEETFGERVFFSSDFKSSKTEAAIFRALLDELGRSPEDTLFIDDSAEYIESAEQAGLRAHHFQGAEGLARELAEQGLL